MTKKELLKALENVPDDYEIMLTEWVELPNCPFLRTTKIKGKRLISHSDKIIDFELERINLIKC